MDAYVALFVFLGLIMIFASLRSIKKDIEKGEKILIDSEKVSLKLSQLLSEATETIEELDSFGEYIIERIENRVKWAKEEMDKIKDKATTKEMDENKNSGEIERKITNNEQSANLSPKKSKEEIYHKAVELYRQGLSIEEVASRLGIGKGEAKLAIKIVGGKKSEMV
ncbi:DUF2802 domain-containing protein [Caldicellulosiruptor naganoensis]|uniref:DUF2802 domain-containing protein n=1 Tax=Caldicellulosiruptor naganoensis TaxID=29324 RepID=A0ABY7BHQ5_9FIRM|nr:DUF2802 domain-containing protein [Caldicellulosiruptor naganoensis]WAM32129.1 DUF2802 domain-containing protein [Caldicellulosiruptor naganoensis]